MIFNQIKSDSFCVGGRNRSATVKVYDDISSEGSEVLIGYCSFCNRKKSMTLQAEGLGDFFRNLGKK